MAQDLVLIGDGLYADIAYEYFTHDSDYRVVGFSVERPYLRTPEKFGLPVLPFDEIDRHFPPATHAFHAAITYGQLNRLRERLYRQAKALGYRPASYVSSRAFVWRNVQLGEHCFIFEDNTVQPFVQIGDNVVLCSGNHIGLHSRIGSHVFIASHAVISGCCEIADHQFIGVNATIANDVHIGADCVLGAGALVGKDLSDNHIVRGPLCDNSEGARRLFKVRDA